MSTLITALLNVSLLATSGSTTYSDAYTLATADEGRPLVVLVAADWCPACQQMKQSVIPQLQQRGSLSRVAFAVVNPDREGPLASQLMEGNSIPQLVMYVKSDKGWTRRQLTGSQSTGDVEGFLANGLARPLATLTSR
ncbi:MAG TPA: thioredoxin family protein [Pirellulales bacterium]|jgi:thiol-disulfide isomerase/thioredoxin|nr:thioredoxin family protein [Pirellulales bacterium]